MTRLFRFIGEKYEDEIRPWMISIILLSIGLILFGYILQKQYGHIFISMALSIWVSTMVASHLSVRYGGNICSLWVVSVVYPMPL